MHIDDMVPYLIIMLYAVRVMGYIYINGCGVIDSIHVRMHICLCYTETS